MHWVLLSGVDGDFMNAPMWAKRLVVVRETGVQLWWDGSKKYQDKNKLSDEYTSDFDEGVNTIAERRLVPIKTNNAHVSEC
ncbi:TPA: hypothetical protein PXO57_004507 [Yersinia enterocolitica]|nr:hypothetical protein [Yersinia enterocolitica]HDL7594002.1 hypothetical protein [Yersinia enterocolitica]HDL7824266.1 hypothetical protein [Yersinia enterocolitica]HDL7832049.1 hypothetical protein [Yersinia enterocolitica]HDL7872713.1 hypothetical protein [Yersinia enterocolitica]